MGLDRGEIKHAAKAAMKEGRPRAVLVTLVFLALIFAVGLLSSMVTVQPSLAMMRMLQMGYSEDVAFSLSLTGGSLLLAALLSVIVALFSTVLRFGYKAWALRRTRGRAAGFSTLLTGFTMPLKSVGLTVFVAVFRFLWTAAVFLPVTLVLAVVVLAVSLAAGPRGWFYGNPGVLLMVPVFVLYAAAAVAAEIIVLRYAMSVYCLLDSPYEGIRAAVNRSKQLMRGRKWFYLKLHLSFAGWYILIAALGAAVLGIGALILRTPGTFGIMAVSVVAAVVTLLPGAWLVSYVQLSDAGFYQAVSDRLFHRPFDPYAGSDQEPYQDW